jgi:hypothetical protein
MVGARNCKIAIRTYTGRRLPLFTELPRAKVFSETEIQASCARYKAVRLS